MIQKQNKSSGAYNSILKVFDILFPSVSELSFTLTAAIVSTVVILNKSISDAIYKLILADLRTLFIPAIILVLFILMLQKRKLSEFTKMGACLLYFGLFAILAFNALNHQKFISNPTPIEHINYLLTLTVLTLSVVRGVITYIVYEIDSPNINKLVTQNFSDIQYRWLSFLLVITIAIISVLIIRDHYDDLATIVVLSYTYASLFLSLIIYIFGQKLIHR